MRAMLYALLAIAWLLVGLGFTQLEMRNLAYRGVLTGVIATVAVYIYFVNFTQQHVATQTNALQQPLPPPCSKSSTRLGMTGTGFIDGVRDADSDAAIVNGAVIHAGTSVTVFGWLSNSNASGPADEACLVMDGVIVPKQAGTYGLNRPDVAAQINNPTLAATGYELRLSTKGMRPGRHTLQVAAVCGVPRRYTVIRSKISFRLQR